MDVSWPVLHVIKTIWWTPWETGGAIDQLPTLFLQRNHLINNNGLCFLVMGNKSVVLGKGDFDLEERSPIGVLNFDDTAILPDYKIRKTQPKRKIE